MQHPSKVAPKRRLGKKLVLILTLALVALGAAFVLLLPAVKRAFPSAKYARPTIELHYKTLETASADELQTLTISHRAGDSFTLRYKDGALWLEKDGGLVAVSEAYSDALLEAATVIAVEDVVTEDASEVAEHLDDMGLAPALATAVARYADGREVTLEVGAGVPETSYSYFRWSGDNGVYMCGVGVTDALNLTANRLLPVTQPVMDKALCDQITLTLADGAALAMRFSAGSGRLTSPVDYPMSAEKADALLTALANFRLGTSYGAVGRDEYAQYGFDAPLLVLEAHRQAGPHAVVDESGQLVTEELAEADFRFTFGRAEGDYFYTCLYEGQIYHVSKFLCQTFMDMRAADLVTRNPADMGDESLCAVVVQTGAGTLDARMTRTERVLPNNELETDEDGNVVYDTAVTINGAEAAQEPFDALVERLKSLTVSGNLPDGWTADGQAPRWTIALTTRSGRTRTIEAYALDAFSDALAVDGTALHYAYIEALDSALAEWMPGK